MLNVLESDPEPGLEPKSMKLPGLTEEWRLVGGGGGEWIAGGRWAGLWSCFLSGGYT